MDYEFTEVNSVPAPAPVSVPVPQAPEAEPAITQNMEETVAIDDGEKERQIQPVEEVRQPTPEEIRAEQERRAAEEAQNLMANAFGRSSSMQSSTTQGTNEDVNGTPGSTQGNSTQGSTAGVGGTGPVIGFVGRTVVELAVPSNVNIPEEAMVVVNIWVDANGNVTKTSINKRTKTMNADLRQRSIEAAKRTKFNQITPDPSAVEDPSGTITYFYQFK